MDKDKMIYELWKALDDIDTLMDMLKPEQNNYTNLVTTFNMRRFEIVPLEYIDELYDKYYDYERYERSATGE